MNEMYKRIEDLCESRGINITQMCKEAGIARAPLSELKMGRTMALSSLTLGKLSSYFEVPMEYFLGTTPSQDFRGAFRNISGSTVVAGNTGDHISVNGPEAPQEALTEQEQEVLRIFRTLDMRKKTSVLSYLYELEDGGK